MKTINEKQEILVKIIYRKLGVPHPKKLMARELILAKHLIEHGSDENSKILVTAMEDMEKQHTQLLEKMFEQKRMYETMLLKRSFKILLYTAFANPFLFWIPVLSIFVAGMLVHLLF